MAVSESNSDVAIADNFMPFNEVDSSNGGEMSGTVGVAPLSGSIGGGADSADGASKDSNGTFSGVQGLDPSQSFSFEPKPSLGDGSENIVIPNNFSIPDAGGGTASSGSGDGGAGGAGGTGASDLVTLRTTIEDRATDLSQPFFSLSQPNTTATSTTAADPTPTAPSPANVQDPASDLALGGVVDIVVPQPKPPALPLSTSAASTAAKAPTELTASNDVRITMVGDFTTADVAANPSVAKATYTLSDTLGGSTSPGLAGTGTTSTFSGAPGFDPSLPTLGFNSSQTIPGFDAAQTVAIPFEQESIAGTLAKGTNVTTGIAISSRQVNDATPAKDAIPTNVSATTSSAPALKNQVAALPLASTKLGPERSAVQTQPQVPAPASQKELLDAIAMGANIGDLSIRDIATVMPAFKEGASAATDNKMTAAGPSKAQGGDVASTATSAAEDSLQSKIAAAKESAELFGTNGVSDVTAPLYDASTPRNADGGVDTAWWVNLGLDKYKVYASTGFGDTNRKIASPAGSPNIFAPDGTQTTTVSGNTVGAAEKAWDVFGDPSKLQDVFDKLSSPGFSFSKWVDKPSITFGTYNDPSIGNLPTGTSYISAGVTLGTPIGKVVAGLSAGNGGGAGATFADLEGKYPVAGSFSVAIDPTRGISRALMTNPITALPGAALGLFGEVGGQNRIGVSVPITFGNVGNPNFEGFRDPAGNVVTDPVNAVKDAAKNSASKEPQDMLMNYGYKRVAGFNNELQLALGNDVFKVASKTRNPATGNLDNNGSPAVGLANQFTNVLQAYGGLRANESISSTADFNRRVDQTINRLHDQGRDKDIQPFIQKLTNPYSVNGGNSYVDEANKGYRGPKVDGGTASEVRDMFNGKYKRAATTR